MRRRAYTLLELLVALTIVVVLAGILMPVFAQVRDEAKQIACTMNLKQVNTASSLYRIDYDDRHVVAKYTGPQNENAFVDRTWVQLVHPYLRNFDSTRCPADHTRKSVANPVFDPDLVPNGAIERFYLYTQRANTGFNFVYLSPLVRESNGQWVAKPRYDTELQSPSETLVFGDSVWSVSPSGSPRGGGSYLIVPPCRYLAPNREDSFGLGTYNNDRIYKAAKVWDDGRPVRRIQFGGLWPWHNGQLTVAMADGRAKAMTMEQVTAGCDVRSNWGGLITDLSKYIWGAR